MKRGMLAIALLVLGSLFAAEATARDCPPVSRYGEWVRVTRDGKVTYRYTYRGKTDGFPPPAMYYYGYPQSGFSYGIGF